MPDSYDGDPADDQIIETDTASQNSTPSSSPTDDTLGSERERHLQAEEGRLQIAFEEAEKVRDAQEYRLQQDFEQSKRQIEGQLRELTGRENQIQSRASEYHDENTAERERRSAFDATLPQLRANATPQQLESVMQKERRRRETFEADQRTRQNQMSRLRAEIEADRRRLTSRLSTLTVNESDRRRRTQEERQRTRVREQQRQALALQSHPQPQKPVQSTVPQQVPSVVIKPVPPPPSQTNSVTHHPVQDQTAYSPTPQQNAVKLTATAPNTASNTSTTASEINKLTKKDMAIGAVGIGAMAALHATRAAKKALNSPVIEARPTEFPRLAFLRPAYFRWHYLILSFPELAHATFEKFKEWLHTHPGILHPTTKKQVTEKDWEDHEAHEEYLELKDKLAERLKKEDEEREKNSEKKKQKLHYPSHDDGYYLTTTNDMGEDMEVPDITKYRRGVSQSTPPPPEPPQQQNSGSGRIPPRRPNRRGGGGGIPGGFPGGGIPFQGAGTILRSIWMIPQVRIAAIIIFIFILLLLLILYILNGSGNPPPGKSVPVTITKSVDKTEVPNPPNSEDITYTIKVSYPGNADDIIVEDPIPEGAVFVSANPPGKMLDAAGKETTDANNVAKIIWSVKDIQNPIASPSGGTPEPATPAETFNQEVFSEEGFPPPTTPAELPSEEVDRWKSFFMPHAIKAAEIVGIDVGYIGFWSFFEGIKYDLRFNNCNNQPPELRWNPNDQCASTNIQVGPGVRPYDLPVSALQEAFDVMYGGHDNETVQRVGQQVIDNMKSRHDVTITYPATTFPNISLNELINADTPEERHWFVHLTKDDAISMYYLAKVFKGHLDSSVLADQMESRWGDPEHYARQRAINYIKAVYDAGLTGGGTGGGTRFREQTLTLTVRAKDDTENTYLINQASTRVIGGSGNPDAPSAPAIPVDLANVEKRLLPDPSTPRCQTTQTGTCGRSLERVKPFKIVMHTTHGILDADGIYEYFSTGADGRGVGSHFIIGQDGKIIQMVELFEDSVEYAQAVGGYQNHISIEMGSVGNFERKGDMPQVQYDAARSLVTSLMEKYDIPKGDIEWNTTVDTQTINDDVKGIFGHYQLNTQWAGDPGHGWLNDFRKEF